jgi:hypothetical protein
MSSVYIAINVDDCEAAFTLPVVVVLAYISLAL